MRLHHFASLLVVAVLACSPTQGAASTFTVGTTVDDARTFKDRGCDARVGRKTLGAPVAVAVVVPTPR